MFLSVVLASHSFQNLFSSTSTKRFCSLFPPPALAVDAQNQLWHGVAITSGTAPWKEPCEKDAGGASLKASAPAQELLWDSILAHGFCLTCIVGMPVTSLVLCSHTDLTSQPDFRTSPSPQPCLAITAIGCPGCPSRPSLLLCLDTMEWNSCPRVSAFDSTLTFPCRAAQQPLLCDRPENVEREKITPHVQEQLLKLQASFTAQTIHPSMNCTSTLFWQDTSLSILLKLYKKSDRLAWISDHCLLLGKSVLIY